MSEACPFCNVGRVVPSPWAGILSCDHCRIGYVAADGHPLRVGCSVPGCRHTRGDRKGDPVGVGMEWVCGDHWRLVPRPMRAIYARIKRKAKRWPDRPIAVHRIWQR